MSTRTPTELKPILPVFNDWPQTCPTFVDELWDYKYQDHIVNGHHEAKEIEKRNGGNPPNPGDKDFELYTKLVSFLVAASEVELLDQLLRSAIDRLFEARRLLDACLRAALRESSPSAPARFEDEEEIPFSTVLEGG